MPQNKVNEPAPPTWDELAKMFSYIALMWDSHPDPAKLFAHLASACQDIAAGK
ncbi:hypothetical protein J8I29_06670 [Labrys sp. LIt4]|uniref:hypothetical protein n=1 Tax=Labrys sp. LIt4 TaxID=2821355 RepID=UPI001ADFD244|nr:hypothetical protein [Labrys sp. LIt4]MBP0578981.1 hypothetical protein [Labrys sp. LIt4]